MSRSCVGHKARSKGNNNIYIIYYIYTSINETFYETNWCTVTVTLHGLLMMMVIVVFGSTNDVMIYGRYIDTIDRSSWEELLMSRGDIYIVWRMGVIYPRYIIYTLGAILFNTT